MKLKPSDKQTNTAYPSFRKFHTHRNQAMVAGVATLTVLSACQKPIKFSGKPVCPQPPKSQCPQPPREMDPLAAPEPPVEETIYVGGDMAVPVPPETDYLQLRGEIAAPIPPESDYQGPGGILPEPSTAGD